MGRREWVHRTVEEKWKIVQEGISEAPLTTSKTGKLMDRSFHFTSDSKLTRDRFHRQ